VFCSRPLCAGSYTMRSYTDIGRGMRRSGYEFDKIDLSENEYPEESSYWYAMDCERTVLAVARSVNATLALIDGLPDLLNDRRVQVLFTLMPKQRDANFERWMRRLVTEAGVREIGWEEAVGRRFDLVVTASYEGALNELSGHVVILNHGTGVGKYLALPPDGRLPVSDDGTSTTIMFLSHSEQRPYYAVEQDKRARFLVAGDPWRDRLCASKHRAGLYREALGVNEHTRLIAVSSTWGEYSLIATRPELPLKLLNELPWDEYRLALILHPNVWFGHSTWQVRTWMREALDAGLLLIPPHGSWRGVLVAADAFVGDHGSMMLHAGALGMPLAFGCAPNDELIEGGPSAELEARVPRLDLHSPLAPQVDHVFAEHDPSRDRATIDRVFEYPGESHAILRRTMYELMELDEPDETPRVLAVDQPEAIHEDVTAHRAVAEVEPDGSVSVARFPVVRGNPTPPPPPPRGDLISPSRPQTETCGCCRAPRSCYVASPIRTGSGAAALCARTPARCSARTHRTPARPSLPGATARRSRLPRPLELHPSTVRWQCPPCMRAGSRVDPAICYPTASRSG